MRTPHGVHHVAGGCKAKVRRALFMAGRWRSSDFPLGTHVRCPGGVVPITRALSPREDAAPKPPNPTGRPRCCLQTCCTQS